MAGIGACGGKAGTICVVGGADGQVTTAHPGTRAKAMTRSLAHGQFSAMRKVVRRAERTRTPALCSSV